MLDSGMGHPASSIEATMKFGFRIPSIRKRIVARLE
jgi:hypothetical protein